MLDLTMSQLIKDVYRYFAYTMLERGWDYFTDRRVRTLKIAGDIVYATVMGSEDYEVQIKPTHLSDSECGCPYKGYCKHMAAVLFQLCDKQEGLDPYKLYKPGGAAWGKSARKEQVQREDAADARKEWLSSAVEIASAATAAVKAAPPVEKRVPDPSENGSVKEWQAYFELIYPAAGLNPQRASSFYKRVEERMMPLAANWSPGLRAMYAIHVKLFIMKQADHMLRSVGLTYGYYYDVLDAFQQIADDSISELLVCLLDASHAADLPAPLLRETAEFLAAHAFPAHRSMMYWIDVYAQIWIRLLFREEALAERERIRLVKALRGLTSTAVSSAGEDRLKLAMMLFHMKAGEDEQARKLTHNVVDRNPQVMFPYLHGFAAMKEWGRLLSWLQWMAPMVSDAHPDTVETYFAIWDHLRGSQSVEAEWKQALVQALPASYEFYTEHLMEAGQFKEWVDFHIATGYTPLDCDTSELRPIAAKRKDLLLPWYHISIEAAIGRRNRDGYEEAGELLVKLQSIYRKLDRTSTWDKYLEHLTQKYSRLRLLKAELQKLKKGGK